jgi:histidinol-phosphatase (PHP family)
MWANFHTHSHYCDGVGKFEDYLDADPGNILSLGFTSHAPVPFDCAWCMKEENLDKYVAELSELQKAHSDQGKTQIYKGLEADFVPGVVSPHTYKDKLDFTVGSIHFVEQLSSGKYWEIDNTYEVFLEGLENIFKNNIKDAICRYFELTREMVSGFTPSIVGHLDKIKIQNKAEKFFRETDPWYRAEIEKTVETISKASAMVEVNTRGLYQKKSATTYPSPWVLELILKKNIPITINSDAHHPRDLTNQFAQTAQQLLQIGFKKIHILLDGQWKPVHLTPNGIVL